MEKKRRQILKPVILILLIGLFLRSIIAFYLYPGYDEAYYYLYSKNLNWSYFDHPLFVAITTGLGVWLTGEVNQFTIRLGTLILYTVSLFILYLTSQKLFNQTTALLTLIFASLIPIFQVAFGVLTLPDVPLIFFWSLTIYLAVNEFFPHQNIPQNVPSHNIEKITNSKILSRLNSEHDYLPSYRLAILGILVGLACLSKYHGFILGIGIIGFCCSSKKYRRALISPWLYLGICLFLLTLFPLWYWNLQHDWISFRFQLSGRFQPNPNLPSPPPKIYNPLDVFVVFLSGIGYLFPTLGFPLWWVSCQSLGHQFSLDRTPLQTKQLFILWVSLPLTFGFTLLGGITQILPTWPMPGFWSLCPILGHYSYHWQKNSPQLVKRWLWFSVLSIYTIFLVGLLHVSTGFLQKPNQFPFFDGLISVENDPSTELIDIVQLRENLLSSPVVKNSLANSSFIFTNAYYLGGYIAMAIAPYSELPVTCFSHDQRGFTFWTHEEKLIGKDGLYITLKRFAQLKELNEEYQQYFDSLEEIAQIPLKRAGEISEIFYIYQGKNLLKTYD